MVAMVEPPTPTPEPTSGDEPRAAPEPTREPAPEPQAVPPGASPAPVADCTQWHTVNPNEARLSQITDWYGLDLATVAALNGLDANAPLTTGIQICLSATSQVQPTTPEPTPAPAQESTVVFAPWFVPFPIHPVSMDVQGFGVCRDPH